MNTLNKNNGAKYFTSGQTAKTLRVSVSTLKRLVNEASEEIAYKANTAGWRLFSLRDVETLKALRKLRKKSGKNFKPSTLEPVNR